MSRFSETLLEHARRPRNLGRDGEADLIGAGDFGGHPPRVEIYLRLDDNVIAGASFHAAGCGVTIGACSALTEMVIGLDVVSAQLISASDLEAALDGVPSDKQHSLSVAVTALHDALSHKTNSKFDFCTLRGDGDCVFQELLDFPRAWPA